MIKQKFHNYFQSIQGKRITIMGLGLNQGGVGTIRFLVQAGAKVLVTDLKTKKELTPSLNSLIWNNYIRFTKDVSPFIN